MWRARFISASGLFAWLPHPTIITLKVLSIWRTRSDSALGMLACLSCPAIITPQRFIDVEDKIHRCSRVVGMFALSSHRRPLKIHRWGGLDLLTLQGCWHVCLVEPSSPIEDSSMWRIRSASTPGLLAHLPCPAIISSRRSIDVLHERCLLSSSLMDTC
jgi:hypothetical protein